MDEREAPKLNNEVEAIYQVKLESQYARTNSASNTIQAIPFQSTQPGKVSFSATGSPTIVKAFDFYQDYETVLFAVAHAQEASLTAKVTNVTKSSVQITVKADIGGNISAVTTASFTVFYFVIGSDA